jgi:RHS repeat-associated protein
VLVHRGVQPHLPPGSTTYQYDLAGNLVSSSQGLGLTYNAKNQTTSVTPPGGSEVTMDYADAPQDLRVRAGGTRMGYNLLGLMSQGPSKPHATWFVRDNEGTLVSMLDQNNASNSHYYLFDGLGSVAATTDQSGNIVRRYTYEPYGKQITPDPAQDPSDPNPWRFASGYFDKATGMLKFGTRYYMPELSQWAQRDPVVGSLTSPMSLNPYAYVECNPVGSTDPSGRFDPCSGTFRRLVDWFSWTEWTIPSVFAKGSSYGMWKLVTSFKFWAGPGTKLVIKAVSRGAIVASLVATAIDESCEVNEAK